MAKAKKPLEAVAGDPALAALREQLTAAAAAFVGDSAHLGELLRAMVDDVQRAAAEPVEIFPVKHHSPASALHMVRRLRERPPRVIFMEGCEDLGAALTGLEHCRFPVALQAYAPEAPAFPVEWTPLNLVAPLTEFSAEYQAIAFSLQSEGTELVFVDRSVDHVFQWMPREGPPPGVDDEESDEAGDDDEEEGEADEEGRAGATPPTSTAAPSASRSARCSRPSATSSTSSSATRGSATTPSGGRSTSRGRRSPPTTRPTATSSS
ncbi:MAG: hypothetical protein H6710_07390 [Myxococcales bacterium]|nr:hypothetical protein [Myxococcales bacterium]